MLATTSYKGRFLACVKAAAHLALAQGRLENWHMATRDKSSKLAAFPAPSEDTSRAALATSAAHNPEFVREFIWSVMSLNAHLEDIHLFWAKRLGVTEPQWLILMAVGDLDQGIGVSGIDVAEKLHVHPAFVTPQTKILEKSGYLRRTVSTVDARFVMMFLTDKARKEIDKLAVLRDQIDSSLFASLDNKLLKDLADKITRISNDAEKVASRLAIEG
jgi:DNA-binding MarR family transcriptional regulator